MKSIIKIKNIKKIAKEYVNQPILSIENITSDSHNKDTASFLIELDDKKLKAIFFRSNEQLKTFLRYVNMIKMAPKILYHSKNIILTEWIEGETFKEDNIKIKDIKKIAQLQVQINKIPIKYNKNKILSKIDSWFNKLMHYIKKNSTLNNKEVKKIKEYYKNNFPKNAPISLIHGDLSEDNLVLTKRRLYTIDNEGITIFLTGFDFGKPINDLCISEKYEKAYLSAYNKIKSVKFYADNKIFYQLIYLTKRLRQKLKKHKKADKLYKKIRKIIGNIK